MKVLFYGGCHAGVLLEIFSRFSLEANFHGRLITNYILIGNGEAFPYDDIKSFDAVVYSPILNKGDYNTNALASFCREHGIATACYPWLQWGGYHPKSVKRAPVDWLYPGLISPDKRPTSFREFRQFAFSEYITGDEINELRQHTTAHLLDAEAAGSTHFSIVDLIEEHYRRHQLFLVPDHPTTFMYRLVAERIALRLGIQLDPSLYSMNSQFHQEHRLMILPQVVDKLGLDFVAGESGFHDRLGHRWYSPKEWLQICYYADDSNWLLTSSSVETITIDGRDYETAPNDVFFTTEAAEGYLLLDGPDAAKRLGRGNPVISFRGGNWIQRPLKPYKDAAAMN